MTTNTADRVIRQLQEATTAAGLGQDGPDGWAPLPGLEGQAADYVQRLLATALAART